MNWYVQVLKKYVVFSGRAQRAEFWYFTLFNFLAVVALSVIDALIGAIVLLVFFVQDSTPGENQYGPNPKG
jgi:uncharacterized membrane protein YhaH (DUF805 family)